MYDQPGIQMVILLLQNLLIIIYNGLVSPLKTAVKNKEELYQESMFMLICYCILLFTRFVPDVEF